MMNMLKSRVLFLIGFVALLWGIEVADLCSGHLLDQVGSLHPRSTMGLAQIFSSPFLHGGIYHLLSNTVALLPLGALMLMQGAFLPVTLISMVVGGLGTWLFATGPSLGFSGVIFGYMGFLLARGLYTRQPLALGLSLLVFFWFSGSIWIGLIPQAGISWAGHFWGFVGGVAAAKFLPVSKA